VPPPTPIYDMAVEHRDQLTTSSVSVKFVAVKTGLLADFPSKVEVRYKFFDETKTSPPMELYSMDAKLIQS
jgi:hypothetical protein